MEIKTITRTVITLFFRAFGAVSMLVLSLVVTRTTSTTESGRFFYCLSLIIPISIITRYGTDYSLVKVISRKENNASNKSMLAASLKITIVFSLLCSALLIAFSGVISVYLLKEAAYKSLLRYSALIIPVTSLINVYASYYQGINKSYTSVFLRNIVQYLFFGVIVLVASMFFLFNSSGLLKIFFCISLIILIVLLVTSKFFLDTNIFKNFLRFTKYDKYLFTKSYNYFVIIIYSTVTQWSSIIIGGFFLNSSDIAYMSIAYRIANVLTLILISVNTVIAPVFSKLYYENEIRKLNAYYINIVKILFVVTTCIVLVFFVFSTAILSLFGPSYISSSHILKIILIGQYINVVTGPVTQLYMMSGREKFYRRTLFYVTILSIILPLILFHLYGLPGGAYAYAAILIIQNLFLFVNFLFFNKRY